MDDHQTPPYTCSAVGSLHAFFQARGRFGDFVFHGDNQNMMGHVFEHTYPTSKEGLDLLPGILLARVLLEIKTWAHRIAQAAASGVESLGRRTEQECPTVSETSLNR